MKQTKAFHRLNSDASDHDLPADDYRDMYNMIPVKDGSINTKRRQTVRGNALIPSDDYGVGAKTVGAYYDEKNNRVIWFNVNGTGEVDLLLYYPETDTIVKRIASDIFDLTIDSNTHTLRVVDHYVLWIADDGQIRQYDLDHEGALGTLFTGDNKVVLLNRPQPYRSPWSKRQTLGSLNVNRIGADSFQFSYQFIYKDGARSVISPLSQSNIGFKVPPSYNDAQNNSIRVYIEYQDIDTLDRVDVMFRRNQNDDYYKFAEITDLSDTINTSDPVGGGVVVEAWYVDFTGVEASTIIPQEDVIKKYESIPKVANDIVFAKSRLFTVRSLQNTDLGDISGIGFTAQAHDDVAVQSERLMYLMPGTSYAVGLEFFNDDMESTTIVKTAKLEVPDVLSTDVEQMNVPNKYRLRVDISGSPPANFDRYRILMTRNQKYSEWCQVSLKFMFWKEEYIEREQEPDSQSFRDINDIYHIPLFLDSGDQISQVHIQIPLNLPFQVTTDHRVRIITNGITGHPASDFAVEQVLAIEGDKIIVGNFGIQDWSFIEASQDDSERLTSMISCEIFKPNDAIESTFYELGWESRVRVVGGVRYFRDTEIYLDGDTFLWAGETKWIHRFIERSRYDDHYGRSIWGFQQAFTSIKQANISPSLTQETEISFVEAIKGEVKVDWGGYAFYTMDYGKQAGDRGRVNINADYNLIRAGYSLAYSKIYKSNTNLNGLNNFDSDATYDLDLEQGEINKLVMIHNNLMIAIHPRSVTSLYLGESFIKQSDAIDIVTKTEGVIGHHRPAQGQYGTINPESVIVADGKAYWWDALRGCIVRYDNNGLDEASKESFMKTFFEDLADALRPYRDIAQVIGEYHEFHSMIYWTFKPVVVEGDTKFAGLTIAYSIDDKAFISKFNFLPERYSRIPQTVVSFKNGQVWKHEENSSHGTFYDVPYLPSVTMLLNADPTQEKIWENIMVDANVKLLINIDNETQHTEIVDVDYFERHSTLYADIMRDMNTPVDAGKNAKIVGDTMLSALADIYMTVSAADALSLVELHEIYVGYRHVSGHLLEAKEQK
jgi:hypothetical protein